MSTAKDDWLTIGHAQAYDVNKSIRFAAVKRAQYSQHLKTELEPAMQNYLSVLDNIQAQMADFAASSGIKNPVTKAEWNQVSELIRCMESTEKMPAFLRTTDSVEREFSVPEEYLEKCDLLRQYYEHPAITTDIIVGFPGETEEDFEETLDVVSKVRYDSAYTFIYSKRSGTPAASMEDQVPEDVVKERFAKLLKVVQTISAERTNEKLGMTEPVLIEQVNEQDESLVTGRLSNNAVVHLPGDASMIGSIVPVLLKESKGFYYMGQRV